MRLQFDPLSNQAKVSLVVQRLEILMREKQFKNIIKLIELDHEYNAILADQQLKKRSGYEKALL